jgi:hypothetical protein
MTFVLPVRFAYNGRNYDAVMGPFEHSAEREFSLTVSKKAIMDCNDKDKLREVSLNLLTAWSTTQTAFQKLMLENINLRQAMDSHRNDIEAAENLLSEAAGIINEQQCELQSKKSRMSLWPW